MPRFVRPAVVVATLAAAALPAHAAYIMTPLSNGQNQRTVALGQTFTLDVVLTSNTAPADTHTSALFQMRFTQPGLVLNTIAWAAPYTTGGAFDFSLPAPADLPLAITPGVLSGGLYPQGLNDIELANALIGQTYGTGTLVSLSFTIPANLGYTGPIFISLNPDEIASGFNLVPTTAGQVFRLDVVIPSPATLALLAPWAMLARRRRR